MDRAVRRVHKLVASAVPRHLRIPLGPQAEYEVSDLARVLVYASENRTAVTWSADHLRRKGLQLPEGDTVLYHLGKVDWRELAKGFTALLKEAQKRAFRAGLLRGYVDIAIDFHDFPWYGEDLPFVVRGEADRGTTRFIRFACLSILTEPVKFIVASAPVFPDTTKVEAVEFLLGEMPRWVRIRRAYLDRGFFSVDALTLLEENNIGYVVAARRTSRVQRAILSLKKRGRDSVKYVVRNSTDSIETTLFIAENDEGEVSAFVTNLPVRSAKKLAETYRKRWNIETTWRVKNGFRAKSCARAYSVRYAIVMLALALYNFWVLANLWRAEILGVEAGKPAITVDDARFALLDLQFPGIR